MFHLLLYAHLGITALLIYSWTTLFFLPPGTHDARPSYKRNTGGLTLLFCAIAGAVWFLQKYDHPSAAGYILYGFYGLILCYYLWILKNINWH